MNTPARIVLVDDSVVIRGLLTKFIEAEPDLTVAGTAANGKLGVAQVGSLNPDLVVLDIEMPVMTGLEALVEIRRTNPSVPIVMFSTLTESGAASTVTALARGASDYATKPTGSSNIADAMRQVQADLIAKIRALVTSRQRSQAQASQKPVVMRKPFSARVNLNALVLGCSTGGPVALETVLRSITTALPIPLFVVQHMPATFTRALADRLDAKVASRVVEAEQGMIAEPGTCYIAPGGFHMELRKSSMVETTINITDTPPINSCKPSVDTLFSSAAKIYGKNLGSVMLTGMGHDGLDGTREIAKLGCPVIAQDEATSVVWGMPGAITTAGLSTEVLPLDRIGLRMSDLAQASRTAPVAGRRPASSGGPA
ncbi:MAG: chemotaxis response regulator protein-glutamate methylesterase [Actinomycetia bacterium]|nr:chemotaxis response regulator protein-glutamate methylesterase [Actinomycetes bacterium]